MQTFFQNISLYAQIYECLEDNNFDCIQQNKGN